MIELPKRVHEHALKLSPASAPVCVYDLPLMTERARLLRASLPAALDLLLPMTDPPPGAAAALAPHASGFVVDSVPAVRAVLRECPGLRGALSGPGKTEAELDAAVADAARAEAVVLADSPGELRLLEHCARRAGHRVGVLLGADPFTAGRAETDAAPAAPWAGMDAAALVECAEALGANPAVRVLGFATAVAGPSAPPALGPPGRLEASGALEALRPWSSMFGISRPEYVFAAAFPDPGASGPVGPGWDGLPSAAGAAEEHIAVLASPPGDAWSGWFLTPVLDVKHRRGRAYAVAAGGRAPHPDAPGFAVVPRDDAWDHPWERPELADEPVTMAFRGAGSDPAPFPPMPVDRLRPGDLVAFPAAPPRTPARTAGPQVHCLGGY